MNEQALRQAIGNRIRVVRHAARLSQRQLAEKLGISPYRVSNTERGRAPLNAIEINDLCKVLDVTPNWLLGWSSDDPEMLLWLQKVGRDLGLTEHQRRAQELLDDDDR